MTPLESYHQLLGAPGFVPDPDQEHVVEGLDRLHRELGDWRPTPTGLLERLRGRGTKVDPIPGIYLWGGVGRGKTFLMDVFFDALTTTKKLRLHFHRFMQLVHEDLTLLKNQSNPLTEVSRRFAERARVLCLDEMQVNDITDAMILAGLFDGLFSRGVTLVTTSNIAPDELYRNGLQRDRFLPAIELIKRHTRNVCLDGPTDYRLRHLEQAAVYHFPLDAASRTWIEHSYRDAVGVDHPKPPLIVINRREIPVVRWTDSVVWFDFDVICNVPRSQLDHVEVARYFHTVLLQNVRRMDEGKTALAHRFMTMVDALYDRNVKLLISAEAAPEALYTGQTLELEFRRTLSRLREIQSHEYLARPHLS